VNGYSDVAVVVTAKSRPDYLERTLRSWEQVRGVESVHTFLLALGRGPMQSTQMGLASDSSLRIRIRLDSSRADASPGMHRAIGEAIDSVLDAPGVNFVILSEEDVVVSDDILEYFDWARERMSENMKLLVACAHNVGGNGWDAKTVEQLDGGVRWALRDDDTDADQQAVRALAHFCGWGWGLDRYAWANIIRPKWDWDCNSGGGSDSGYDWNMQLRILSPNGHLALVPDAARTQNIGELGGTYSTPAIHALQQSLSFREHREPVEYQLKDGS